MKRQRLTKLFGLHQPKRLAAIILATIIFLYFFPRYVVATDSMHPTISRNSYVVAFRPYFWFKRPTVNDIGVFKPHERYSPYPWIHRIVAVEGDTYLPPVKPGRVDIYFGPVQTRPDGSIVIPKNCVYQSGDNPRTLHGLVSEEMLRAKTVLSFRFPWSRGNDTPR